MADFEDEPLEFLHIRDADGIECRMRHDDGKAFSECRTQVRVTEKRGGRFLERSLPGDQISEAAARRQISLARERWREAGGVDAMAEASKLRFVHDAAAENQGNDYFLGMMTGIRFALEDLGYEFDLDEDGRIAGLRRAGGRQ